jgi:ferredoxin--NADP+ reductase
MNRILFKRTVAPLCFELVLDAPAVANAAAPGQFVILRVDADGERVPFTICDFDKNKGTITLLVQAVGYTTRLLANLNAGDFIEDLVGPLGKPTDLSAYQRVALVGGGIGAAVIFPQAKKRAESGVPADVVIGARSRELLVYEPEFKAAAKELFVATDDGSYGEKGFVTDVLTRLLARKHYDCVFAVGPLAMMRAVCRVTKPHSVHTVVSMNATMVDGTGMCGCCRVTVDGKIKYACVDGPEFDGHLIDFDEAINRSRAYLSEERAHVCGLTGEVR